MEEGDLSWKRNVQHLGVSLVSSLKARPCLALKVLETKYLIPSLEVLPQLQFEIARSFLMYALNLLHV
jgi:hypothetical protein